ncbi:MAG TPA: adenylate/guanylate cyclase domain-containing protein [Candidatus Limnocylindria bacterium]|nr:adenylate/guanylate cyclase domain-containing protein [Candidatus Limnocylindria bacterium]
MTADGAMEAAGAREERRLVTCLFIDIVGSTELTARVGPERQKRALDAAFEEVRARIATEGGTVEKYIGDAVYALFGAPSSHADDPLRALRAAHACREWAARPDAPFAVRIGVETGEAVVDLTAAAMTHQRMSVGAVVNTAARLEQAADPGQILVGPRCHEVTATSARFRALGPMTFKGLAPMEVWELEAPGEATTSIDLPFVGRSGDLEILRLAYRRSQERAVLALVTGPPGQGKTRVVRELFDGIGREPVVARFRPRGELGATAPLRGLLGGTNGPEEVANALGQLPASERERISRGVLHSSGLVPDERLGQLNAEERLDEVVHAWRRFLAARSSGSTPIVWFEDVHWADEEAVRLLDRLTLSTEPLLLVATARPEFAQASGLRPSGDRFFVELGPLDTRDAQELASAAGAPDRSLVERAQGNPLFIVELARAGTGPAELPLTLQGALGARLDELALTERDLLSRAAVAGETFDVEDVAALTGREPNEIAAALGRLADLLYLRRVGTAYRFHHGLLRDVAYGRLLVADRMRLHARLAMDPGRTLDAEVRAHHWWEALGPPDSEWVWDDAAERATMRAAAVAAHLAAAEGHLARNDGPRAETVLARASHLADDPSSAAAIARARGRAATMDRRGDDSWAHYTRAAELYRSIGQVPADMYPEWLRAPIIGYGSFHHLPDQREIRAILDEGVRRAGESADRATQARLDVLRAIASNDVVLATNAVERAADALPARELASALADVAALQFQSGDLDAMSRMVDRLRSLVEATSDPEVLFVTRRRLALWKGDLAEAHRLAIALDEATRSVGPHLRSHTLATLAWQAAAEGDWAWLRRVGAEMLALVRRNDGTKFCAMAHSGLSTVALGEIRDGRMDEAREIAARARALNDEPDAPDPSVTVLLGDRSPLAVEPAGSSPHAWTEYGIACIVANDRERAEAALTHLDAIATRGAWLAGATAAAMRDELSGASLAGSGHAALRERGYVGHSEILTLRAGR